MAGAERRALRGGRIRPPRARCGRPHPGRGRDRRAARGRAGRDERHPRPCDVQRRRARARPRAPRRARRRDRLRAGARAPSRRDGRGGESRAAGGDRARAACLHPSSSPARATTPGVLAAAGVARGMLFVRSRAGGISHAPEERTSRRGRRALRRRPRRRARRLAKLREAIACAPSQRTRRPSSRRCSMPSTIVAKWLPASGPALLAKLT